MTNFIVLLGMSILAVVAVAVLGLIVIQKKHL